MKSNKRIYYLICPKCNGDTFSMRQLIEKGNDETWRDLIQYKLLCHDGFGWELEDFTFYCSKCGEVVPEVKYKRC